MTIEVGPPRSGVKQKLARVSLCNSCINVTIRSPKKF